MVWTNQEEVGLLVVSIILYYLLSEEGIGGKEVVWTNQEEVGFLTPEEHKVAFRSALFSFPAQHFIILVYPHTTSMKCCHCYRNRSGKYNVRDSSGKCWPYDRDSSGKYFVRDNSGKCWHYDRDSSGKYYDKDSSGKCWHYDTDSSGKCCHYMIGTALRKVVNMTGTTMGNIMSGTGLGNIMTGTDLGYIMTGTALGNVVTMTGTAL